MTMIAPVAAGETSRHPGALSERFRHFAAAIAMASGTAWTFLGACAFLIAWGCSYPLFLRFHDPFAAWQLVINTATTIITFLMVFLIQNAQNRDAKAIHLKLDELIRAQKGARNRLVELENCTDEELEQLRREFARIHAASLGRRGSHASPPSPAHGGAEGHNTSGETVPRKT